MPGEFTAHGVAENFMARARGGIRALQEPEEAFLCQKGGQTLAQADHLLKEVLDAPVFTKSMFKESLETALENQL